MHFRSVRNLTALSRQLPPTAKSRRAGTTARLGFIVVEVLAATILRGLLTMGSITRPSEHLRVTRPNGIRQ